MLSWWFGWNKGKAQATPSGGARTWRRTKWVNRIERVEQLDPAEREALAQVVRRYAFRANDYYLGLIDWSDADDPIRRLIIPHLDELAQWGDLDASKERTVTVARGVQHKYRDTVLLLCNEVCGAYCRYCFRKRLFMADNHEVSRDVSEGLRYIAAHPEVNNVLLTGGDPLLMSTRRLEEIVAQLRSIPHVRIIRIGSKMPAFDPFRVRDDDALHAMFRRYSTPGRRMYLMAHFDHPRELTRPAREAIARCLDSGLVCVNQCPLVGGVNDDAQVLAALFQHLSYIGCPQYYLFQGRPTQGNQPYKVPLVEGWRLFQQAISRGSGLARRARYVMSHATGKIEILAVDDQQIYLRYHQAKDPRDAGRLIVCRRDDEACWLDELEPADQTCLVG